MSDMPDDLVGPLKGDPQCCMSIFRNSTVTCPCRLFPQCHMSNIRNVTMIVNPCHVSLCPMLHVDLRNAHVALSILGV